MKKVLIIVLVMALVTGLVPMGIAMAAKPQTAIEMSNGMPSGDHETLLIHGKNESFVCTECDPAIDQCNVVNIPEYGTATIKYVSGRKVKIDELTVFDSCAGFEGENDIAEVWLPYEQEGYYVFARALGKPGKGDEERYIILENESLEAYPLLEDVSHPDDVILGLGMITQQGVFKKDTSGELYRFDGDGDKGKGKSKGIDITDLFLWSGFAFDPSLDLNDDNVVDTADVIYLCGYDTNANGLIDTDEYNQWLLDTGGGLDNNGDSNIDWKDVVYLCGYDTELPYDGVISWDGVIDEYYPNCEFENWLNDQVDIDGNLLWGYYSEDWVFTIADLVYQNQVFTNEGIKNLQIRFYPCDTTIFEQAE